MNKRAVSGFVLALHLGALALSSIGCSGTKADKEGGKEASSLAALGIDDGASLGQSTSALVKPDEEATLTLKTGAEVKVPKGALQVDTKIGLKRPADKEAMELAKTIDEEQKMASAPYVLTPHGTSFKEEVEVSLPIAKDRDTKKLKVVYLEDEKDKTWEDMGAPESKDGKATIKVNHFSVLMLVEVQNDARPANNAPGTSEESDAGSDIMTPGSDAGGNVSIEPDDFRARLLQRFEQCGLIARQGDYQLPRSELPFSVQRRCMFECFLTASCADFTAFGCETGDSDDAAHRAVEQACRVACGTDYTESSCPDGKPADVCDGYEDCADGSDENGCPAGTHFTCSNGELIPAGNQCDGDETCADGSDENGCPAGIHFFCTNGSRESAKTECDGYEDCTDGSDEASCAGKLFTCTDGSSNLAIDVVCDAERQCVDGSDEPARCLQLTCAWNL